MSLPKQPINNNTPHFRKLNPNTLANKEKTEDENHA